MLVLSILRAWKADAVTNVKSLSVWANNRDRECKSISGQWLKVFRNRDLNLIKLIRIPNYTLTKTFFPVSFLLSFSPTSLYSTTGSTVDINNLRWIIQWTKSSGKAFWDSAKQLNWRCIGTAAHVVKRKQRNKVFIVKILFVILFLI